MLACPLKNCALTLFAITVSVASGLPQPSKLSSAAYTLKIPPLLALVTSF